MSDILPLYNQEAEESLIGAALINPAVAADCDLRPEDFYVHRHTWIWAVIQGLTAKGHGVDVVTISEALDRAGKLAEVGGPAALMGLMNVTPTSMHAESYASIVKDLAMRRRLLQIAGDLATAAYDQRKPVDDAVISASTALTGSVQPKGAAVPLAHYISQLYDDVEERANNPTDVFGISTGVLDYDKATGGGQAGETLYIGGEPGIGKSILSMQMGIGMAQAGSPGAIYSLEMRSLQVARRIVSGLGQIETLKLKTGKLLDADWPIFTQACETAEHLPVFLSDASYWTMAGMRADLARLKTQAKIEWFVLDYLLLMADGEGKLDEIERSALLSRRIKLISKEFDLFGVTVNSVTKDGDLRGSNQVKHDADVIMMLTEHQPENGGPKQANMRTAIFKKGRELACPKGYFHLVKADSFPAFRAYAEPEPRNRNYRRDIE